MMKTNARPTNGKKVEDLEVGDRVDLTTCPYLNAHPSAEFELALVIGIERETDGCVAVNYEGIDTIGYQTGTVLEVQTRE